jgi:hypothetical protein
MRANKERISLRDFIVAAELLDQAFAGPVPVLDLLAHQCELAEQALYGLVAKLGSTSDMKLAEMFALTHRVD